MINKKLGKGILTLLFSCFVFLSFYVSFSQAQGINAAINVYESINNFSQENSPVEIVKVVWVAGDHSNHDIGEETADFYYSLFRAGQLPIKQIVNKDEGGIENVLRKNNLLFGSFPDRLDGVLCELNQHICHVNNFSSPKDCLMPAVGEIVKGSWNYKVGDVVNIPNVQFVRGYSYKNIEKKQDETLRSLVKAQEGCEKYDEKCTNLIKTINRTNPDVMHPRYWGEVMIPTLLISANLEIRKDRCFSILEKNLAEHLVPDIDLRLNSDFSNEPLFSDINRVFKSIHHPLSINDLPQGPTPVHVGVLDNRVDSEHCELDGKTTSINDTLSNFPKRLNCGVRSNASKGDHGTHVSAIIGGKLNNFGGAGINPNVKLFTYEVYGDKFRDQKYLSNVQQKIHDGLSNFVSLFNVSMKYSRHKGTGQKDLFEETIKANKGNVLFIASAGNSGENLTNKCDYYPACFDFPNVISVVALDSNVDSPSLWKGVDNSGSNFGEQLDLAAPGENILSATRNNGFGLLSGTSQATAIVTGAVSLLLAKDNNLRPLQIKNRLIYTSDLFFNLRKKVFGGRINIESSLKINEVQFKLKPVSEECGFVDFPDNASIHVRTFKEKFIFKLIGSEKTIELYVGAIKRLYYDTVSNSFMIYYFDAQGLLRKATGAYLDGEGAEHMSLDITMGDDAVGSPTISLNCLEDYVGSL